MLPKFLIITSVFVQPFCFAAQIDQERYEQTQLDQTQVDLSVILTQPKSIKDVVKVTKSSIQEFVGNLHLSESGNARHTMALINPVNDLSMRFGLVSNGANDQLSFLTYDEFTYDPKSLDVNCDGLFIFKIRGTIKGQSKSAMLSIMEYAAKKEAHSSPSASQKPTSLPNLSGRDAHTASDSSQSTNSPTLSRQNPPEVVSPMISPRSDAIAPQQSPKKETRKRSGTAGAILKRVFNRGSGKQTAVNSTSPSESSGSASSTSSPVGSPLSPRKESNQDFMSELKTKFQNKKEDGK